MNIYQPAQNNLDNVTYQFPVVEHFKQLLIFYNYKQCCDEYKYICIYIYNHVHL